MPQIIELPCPPDGNALYFHFTGGFRAAHIANEKWRILPVFVNSKPCIKEPLTREQLNVLAKQNNFEAVAFQQIHRINGAFHSSWVPIVRGKSNYLEGPSRLWSNIAGNLSESRTKLFFDTVKHPSEMEIQKVLDDQNTEEALARYISVSLRSMDISVEQISDHYHEQLVNQMTTGRVNGEKFDNTLSSTLDAHVHSFFLHLGAARDYLGTLIAYRMGFDLKKVDSMARLVNEIRQKNLSNNALLGLLFSSRNIIQHPKKKDKFALSGWMKEVSEIRNELVHKRPYGSKLNEQMGWVVSTQGEAGLYRYWRPLEWNGNAKLDVFDAVLHHYAQCNSLMHDSAEATGNDTAMRVFTDEDEISVKV